MSDRFVLHATDADVEAYFAVEMEAGHNFSSNYNISVGALHPLVLQADGERQIKQAKWGLIPPEADDERAGKEHSLIKVEDLEDDGWLSECVEKRRALVPADGFYKWKSTENKTTPFYVRMLSGELIAIAGIYSLWESASGRRVYSFSILTTESNALIEPIDDRMPVVIRPDNFEDWLNTDIESSKILKQITDNPTQLTEMIVNRVSEEVNDISNNKPELIQPIPK